MSKKVLTFEEVSQVVKDVFVKLLWLKQILKVYNIGQDVLTLVNDNLNKNQLEELTFDLGNFIWECL